MPEFFVAIRSGHELTSLSALYEYLGATLVLTMPSAVALGRWLARVSMGTDRRGSFVPVP